MNNSGSDFSGVKVGDRLWYIDREVEVISICHTRDYPILVKNRESTYTASFKHNGSERNGGPQVLFWDKVEITPPPRPKRLVKKTIEVRPIMTTLWGLVIRSKDEYHFENPDAQCVGPVQPIEIEVEE